MNQTELLERLLDALEHGQKCGQCKCGCPEDNLLQQSAVRFNEQASFNAAQLQQAAVQQQYAQFSALLEQQSRIFRTV